MAQQPLITNFFRSQNGQFTNSTFEKSIGTILASLSREYIGANTRVDVDDEGDCIAYLPLHTGDVKIGHLDLINIGGLYWINNVEVEVSAQRSGVGTKMYKKALSKLRKPI